MPHLERPDKTQAEIQNLPESPFLDNLWENTVYLLPADRIKVKDTASFAAAAFRASHIPARDDGTPAVSHSIETAGILVHLLMPAEALQMALLHDVPEDTDVNMDQIRTQFGDVVADGVDRIHVVKTYDPKHHTKLDSEKRDKELEKKLYEAAYQQPLAAIVRFSERLHNLRSIKAKFEKNPESARKTARETLTIYVPLLRNLHLDFMADEMAEIALRVLFPEQLDIVQEKIPAFSEKRRTDIEKKVRNMLAMKPAATIAVIPPHIEDLLKPLEDNMPPNLIAQQITLPFHLYIHTVDGPQKGEFFEKLRTIPQKDFKIFSTPDTDPITGANLAIPPPLSFTLLFHDLPDQIPTPVHLFLTTDDEWISRFANPLEIYSVGDWVHWRYAQAAREMITKLGAVFEEAARTKSRGAREVTLYKGEMEQNLIDVVANVDGINYPIRIPADSTFLDAAAYALSQDDFLHLSYISLIPDKKPMSIGLPISENQALFIKLDKEKVYARPVWLHSLSTAEPELKLYLKDLLRQMIDGKYGGNTAYTKEELALEAQTVGKDDLRYQYQLLTGSEYPGVAITRGISSDHFRQYEYDTDKLLTAVGLNEIPETALHQILRKIEYVYNHLPQITIRIQKDRPGWLKAATAVITGNGLNIVENRSRETLEAHPYSVMQFTVESVTPLNAGTMTALLQKVVNELAKPQPVHLFKFAGVLRGQQVTGTWLTDGNERLNFTPQKPANKRKGR